MIKIMKRDTTKIIDIWPVRELKYYGECWDCGKVFRKHQVIKLDERDRVFHKKCAKRRVWREKNFSEACTISQRRLPYAKTPLLFKTSDKVEITAPEGYEPIMQTFGEIVQFLGYQKI